MNLLWICPGYGASLAGGDLEAVVFLVDSVSELLPTMEDRNDDIFLMDRFGCSSPGCTLFLHSSSETSSICFTCTPVDERRLC